MTPDALVERVDRAESAAAELSGDLDYSVAFVEMLFAAHVESEIGDREAHEQVTACLKLLKPWLASLATAADDIERTLMEAKR